MCGHVHVKDAAALERKHDEYVEDLKRHRRHGKEVEHDRAPEMVAHERAPRLRWRPTRSVGRLRHELGHGVLVHAVAELRELLGDTPAAPPRVVVRHAHDERDDLGLGRRASATLRLPRPKPCEPASMPRDDGLGLHDGERTRPLRPDAREHEPEGAIDGKEVRARLLASQHRELLAQREVLRDDPGPRPLSHRRERAAAGSARQPRIVWSDAVQFGASRSRERDSHHHRAWPLGRAPDL